MNAERKAANFNTVVGNGDCNMVHRRCCLVAISFSLLYSNRAPIDFGRGKPTLGHTD